MRNRSASENLYISSLRELLNGDFRYNGQGGPQCVGCCRPKCRLNVSLCRPDAEDVKCRLLDCWECSGLQQVHTVVLAGSFVEKNCDIRCCIECLPLRIASCTDKAFRQIAKNRRTQYSVIVHNLSPSIIVVHKLIYECKAVLQLCVVVAVGNKQSKWVSSSRHGELSAKTVIMPFAPLYRF
jgi:hypothetical protein